MAERREEEEGGEATQRRGSRATYRPESTWVRGVVPGGGGFGSGAHDGERAERAGSAAHGGVSCRLGRAPRTRASVGRCQGASQVVLGGFSGPFGRWRAMDEVHRRRTAGGGRNKVTGKREMEVRAFL